MSEQPEVCLCAAIQVARCCQHASLGPGRQFVYRVGDCYKVGMALNVETVRLHDIDGTEFEAKRAYVWQEKPQQGVWITFMEPSLEPEEPPQKPKPKGRRR